jgi:hypothetical protein
VVKFTVQLRELSFNRSKETQGLFQVEFAEKALYVIDLFLDLPEAEVRVAQGLLNAPYLVLDLLKSELGVLQFLLYAESYALYGGKQREKLLSVQVVEPALDGRDLPLDLLEAKLGVIKQDPLSP